MKLFLQNIRLQNPKSELHDGLVNIDIENGIIKAISPFEGESQKADFDGQGKVHASIGWFDPSVTCGEPYSEERGTFQSLTHSAHLGGYTDIGIISRPNYIINNSERALQIKQASSEIDFHPIASLSKKMDGVHMNEYRMLESAGVLGFADVHSSPSYNMLKNTSEYLINSTLPIVIYPQDYHMIANGQMNEGYYSTLYGMAGINRVSEHIAISSLGELTQYTDRPIHLAHISTRESLDILSRYPLLSAQIPIGLLTFIDRDMEYYDANMKCFPPFRSDKDRQALIQAIVQGQVTEVVSDHCPWNIEEKDKEFDYAQFGIMSLEVVYSLLNELLGDQLPQSQIVDLISTNTRARYQLHNGGISIGDRAKITLFDPNLEWQLENKHFTDTHNSPWFGQNLIGKAVGSINGVEFKQQF